MNPRHEPPWGNACELPTDSDGRIIPPANRSESVATDEITGAADTADARKVRNDPNLNEGAAHRAARRRMRVIENRGARL